MIGFVDQCLLRALVRSVNPELDPEISSYREYLEAIYNEIYKYTLLQVRNIVLIVIFFKLKELNKINNTK